TPSSFHAPTVAVHPTVEVSDWKRPASLDDQFVVGSAPWTRRCAYDTPAVSARVAQPKQAEELPVAVLLLFDDTAGVAAMTTSGAKPTSTGTVPSASPLSMSTATHTASSTSPP